VIAANAIWLIPGLEHPVFSQCAAVFSKLFARFEALDYRAAYLAEGQRSLEKRIVSAMDSIDARLLIYTQFPSSYSYISPYFLASLRRRRVVVGLGWDDEMYFEQAKFFYQSCDAVVTTDLAGAEWLKQIGIPAHAAALQLVPPARNMSAVPEDIPVSFVGDMTKPGRRKYVAHLESHGIPVKDYGKGSRNGRVSDADVLALFFRTKINLNFTKTNPPGWVLRHDPLRGRFGQIKSRPFELAAMGRFCLCEWLPCVEYWFDDGMTIGTFRNPGDLVHQVQRYLHDDDLRLRIAASAHKRYKSELAPEIQFERIFSQILADSRDVATHPVSVGGILFIESMGRSRGVAFLHALRRGSLLRALGEILTTWSGSFSYWRGFLAGIKDALITRFRRA